MAISERMQSLSALMSHFAQPGTLEWIGLRPARRADMLAVPDVDLDLCGLVGDHRSAPGKRAVTLVQAEHLPVIATLSGHAAVDYPLLRRNLGVSGLNLLALRGRRVRLGSAVLRLTGPCAPCSRMEAALGHGGYTAMRGHGGVTAEVLSPGHIALRDRMCPQTGD